MLDQPAGFYINDVLSSLTIDDVWSGTGKALFFGYFVSLVACRNGLAVTGGADGVGRATTETVVFAAILVLISDFFLTQLFFLLLG